LKLASGFLDKLLARKRLAVKFAERMVTLR
jgi:hypothetical protein